MNLYDLVTRGTPRPWSEGDNIPWNDPEFSKRMLKEHLTQDHDAASRRLETIDRHVGFIHEQALGGKAGRVLDLGCGPGLYAQRLARLGHSVCGVDFSPASIEYAQKNAVGLDCSFTLADVRKADYGEGEYDLAMFIFGEINVFSPADTRCLLRKAHAALKPGGRLLLEPSTEANARSIGKEPAVWYTSTGGLFSDRPHLMLHESYWDEDLRVATNRHIVIDAETAQVTRYAASYQCYTHAELTALLEECGFTNVRFYPSLTGEDDGGNFWAVIAERAE